MLWSGFGKSFGQAVQKWKMNGGHGMCSRGQVCVCGVCEWLGFLAWISVIISENT